MANPSLKNGYMSVANELVEKLATISISGSEMRIVWSLWRKTWCWKEGDRHKDWDKVSISQFERMTTMKRPNVSEAIKSLVAKRLLLKSDKGYKFNQNYDEWVVVKRLPPVVKSIRSSSQTTTEGSSQKHDYKRKIKETIQKKGSDVPSQEIAELIDSFKEVNPMYSKWFGNKTQRGACERLITVNGLDKVKKVIALLPKTNGMDFMPVITSPIQLEDKFAQLATALQKYKNNQPIML